MEIAKSRSTSTQNTEIENVSANIQAVAEAYPELKSNENYKEFMNELSITENLIAEYRSNYNKQVKEYNRCVRSFPANMFLSMTGYTVQKYDYLNYDTSEDAPQNLFGDN
jgi:LemA protein